MSKPCTVSLCFALCIFVTNLYGQANAGSSISGKIVETSTQEPMEFVNVAIYKLQDSSLITGVITNKNGTYLISNITDGSYYIQVTFIGFETVKVPSFTLQKNQTLILPVTEIQLSDNLLNAVEVTEEKSVYENSIDRKVYNVDKDLMSKASSVSEILNNVPSVSVDIDGGISLRGSGNVTILINGKPSAMMKVNSASALQSIPANTIERIEIITNPSAKYKPDGTAGIINIILKKESKQGLNGVITANASDYERFNSNITLNYKPGKLNLFGNYSIRQDYRLRTFNDSRTLTDSTTSTYVQNRSSNYRPLSHVANLSTDYTINNKNTISISGGYFYQDFLVKENAAITLRDDEQLITSDYNRNRVNNEYEWDKEVSAGYEHNFKKEDHVIQFELELADHFEQENNKYTNAFRIPAEITLYDNTLIQQKEKQTNFVTEYTYPINEDAELEAGYVLEFFNQDFNFYGEYYDSTQNAFIKDIQKSNRFKFDQNIHALYTTYSQSIEDFSFLLGLRAEQANISSNLITLDSIVPNNYFKLYPTIHLSYELSDLQEVQLNYSRRVNRPEGDELNPFPEYRDPLNLQAGNPDLKPEQIHSVELGYRFRNNKISFVPSIFYRYKYDGFAEISKYINDTTLLTTSENLSSEQSAGLELVMTSQIKKAAFLNFSANVFYNEIDASNLGYSSRKSALSYNAKLGVNINLTKTTVMQLNANYSSAQLTPQGKILPRGYLNAGVRQDLFKKKSAVLLTVSDVFNTLRWATEIDTPTLSQKIISKRKSQIIYIGFTYRFGTNNKSTPEELKFDVGN